MARSDHRRTSGWMRESAVAFTAGAVGRAAGFLLTILIARRFGATSETDAFYLALSVTVYLSEIVRMAIEGAFVPSFVAARARGEREANEFFVGTATLLGGAGLVAALLITTVASLQATRGAIGPFSVESLQYLKWMAFLLVPTLLSSAANMALYALHVFALPALLPLVQALVVLAALLLSDPAAGAGVLVTGYLAGAALQLAVLLLVLRRCGMPVGLGRPASAVVAACIAALPIALGGVLINANAVIDKVVAGWLLPPGSISILENAGRIYAILTFLSYSALANVLTIRWSELAADGDPAKLGRSFVGTMVPTTLGVAFVGLAMAWLSGPVISLLFGDGAYEATVGPTANALAFLAVGLPLFFFSGMASRFLYALGQTSVGVRSAGLALAVNIPADVLLGQRFGVVGIASATSLTYLIVASYLLWRVRRQLASVER